MLELSFSEAAWKLPFKFFNSQVQEALTDKLPCTNFLSFREVEVYRLQSACTGRCPVFWFALVEAIDERENAVAVLVLPWSQHFSCHFLDLWWEHVVFLLVLDSKVMLVPTSSWSHLAGLRMGTGEADGLLAVVWWRSHRTIELLPGEQWCCSGRVQVPLWDRHLGGVRQVTSHSGFVSCSVHQQSYKVSLPSAPSERWDLP